MRCGRRTSSGSSCLPTRAELVEDLGTGRTGSATAIEKYESNGGTALYDALADSLERLNRVDGRRVIVVVTDGRDENNPGTGPGSRWTFEQVLASAGEVDAAIFGIGVGPNVDRRVLETLAAASGGEAYFPQDVTQLDARYRRVLETLRRRWIITYSSTDTAVTATGARSRSGRRTRTPWFAAGAAISRRGSKATMDISGKPREGWMTVVPVIGLHLLFVVVSTGRARQLLSTPCPVARRTSSRRSAAGSSTL